VNGPLLRHTWRANRWRLLVVVLAMAVWGTILPIVYDAFGAQMRQFVESSPIPKEFLRFGGGDIFSLTGAMALGFVHPIAVGLNLVFAVGFTAAAVAGELQRGTFEVLLSRPLGRRTVYLTLAAAGAAFVAATVAALVLGNVLGTALTGRMGELAGADFGALWLNDTLLYWAFGAIALLASVASDRLTPAFAVSLTVVLVSYFLDVIGSLWPDAAWLQAYSLFHYVDARADLAGLPRWSDFAVLAVVIAAAVAAALVVFPKRDLAAPA